MKRLKVGILGTGDVARTFATGCLELGYEVKLGGREPGNARSTKWAEESGEAASTGTFEEAAAFGDVVIIATLGAGAENAVRLAKAENFRGKVVIDLANPLTFPEGQPPQLFVGGTDSLSQRLQSLLPEARVVKAFNTVGHGLFVKPALGGVTPDMFLCGNDPEAKRIVSGLCNKWGWRPVDLGGLDAAPALEAMVLVWIRYGLATGQWQHAFKLLSA